MRSLLARTYKLVSSDIPKQELPFNFKLLQDIESKSDKLPTLFGITQLTDAQAFNANFEYTLTDVAKKLGGTNWYYAEVLLAEVRKKTGISIKITDNKYHVEIKTGSRSTSHKYSQYCIELLQKVKNGEDYVLDMPK